MFDKLMNSYFYGKSGKGDYRKEDLPRTRWQLFWEMLRVRIAGLMRLNLVYMLIWLPAIIVLVFGAVSLTYTVLADDPAMADPAVVVEEGEMPSGQIDPVHIEAWDPAEVAGAVQSVILLTLVLLVPCIAITGPFTAGLSYVTRNWARDEHAFAFSDFWDAVKANWKPSLVVSFITSLMPLVIYLCWTYYGQLANEHAFMVLPQTISVMVGLIWSLAVTYTYPMLVTYQMRLRDVLRNSFLLAVGRLPMSVGIRLLHCVPLLIAFLLAFLNVNLLWTIFGLAGYYIIAGFGLSRFVTASYTNGVFDKFINSRIEGAIVDRGLNTDPEEEDDEDAGEE